MKDLPLLLIVQGSSEEEKTDIDNSDNLYVPERDDTHLCIFFISMFYNAKS